MKGSTRVAGIALLACAAAGAAPPSKPTDAKLVERVNPNYARTAARSQVEGCVVVAFDLDADGRPANLEIADAVPTGLFEKPTLAALEQWRFEPPAVPCPARYYTRLDFKLETGGIPPARECNAPPPEGCGVDASAVRTVK